MVLVPVATEMREDHVGGARLLELFEVLLDVRADVRKETIAELLHHHGARGGLLEKAAGAVLGLALPLRVGAEHDPMDLDGAPRGE